jgi:hypothetical protein
MRNALLVAALFLFTPLTAFAAWSVSPSTLTSPSQSFGISAGSLNANNEVCIFTPDGVSVGGYCDSTCIAAGWNVTMATAHSGDVNSPFPIDYPSPQNGVWHFVEIVRSSCSGDWYVNECGVSYAATIAGCSNKPQDSTLTYTATAIFRAILVFFGWF